MSTIYISSTDSETDSDVQIIGYTASSTLGRYYLCFDVGLKNLAVSCAEQKEDTYEVVYCKLFDVSDKSQGNISIPVSVANVCRELLDTYPAKQIEIVLVERQVHYIRGSNSSACLINTTVEGCIHSAFRVLGVETRSIEPPAKLYPELAKVNYSRRKKTSFHLLKQLVMGSKVIGPPVLQIIEDQRKQDDLSDSILMLLSFMNKHCN
jgi:hypothetical protein